ncbi:MAG TPA: L-lactate dehydrogenase [Alcanivoracaceae bacterium]|nr:L-lactate dehydrogenase [Alcanivoracaceae bacterium]
MAYTLPSSAEDFRALARGKLPRFLFDYIEGGANAEETLNANTQAWRTTTLRQRVLINVDDVSTHTQLLGEPCSLPVALAPIGLAGMMARRGEVQAVRAANQAQIPFTLSTVGICSLSEVSAAATAPFWFQLYMIRDRGRVAALLDEAWANGCRTLVFTVDLPQPGMRHRDTRNGLNATGAQGAFVKALQLLPRLPWVWNVAIKGSPLTFGNLSDTLPHGSDLDAFKAWIDSQFDTTVTWDDIAWLRTKWQGKLLLKGILDVADAEQAVAVGADGIVVSNHGGRQLDGVKASAHKLPEIAAAVAGRTTLLVDGGIRNGIDVFRAIALGADGVMMGRPWIWAIAAQGEAGLARLLATWQEEFRLAMVLAGVTKVADISAEHLDL